MSEGSQVYVGTAGWSYKDWDGIVYPAQIKKSQHPVEYLAHYIDVLEVNTSFYGHIKPEWGKLWCRMARNANPRFQFTAKLNKAFTHSPIAVVESTSADTIRATAEDEQLAKAGLESIAAEGMLGAVLAQFPISFKNTYANREYLDTVIERFKAFPLVIEVRHNSWTNEGTLRYFAKKAVSFCNIDQPVLGNAVTRASTSPRASAMFACMAATTSNGSTATRATTATTISTPIPNCEAGRPVSTRLRRRRRRPSSSRTITSKEKPW